MYQSSHHRNVFLSLSPQPTHLHLLRDTQTWVFISPSLRMKDVTCKLLQMLILQWRKDLTLTLSEYYICFLPFIVVLCGCNIVQLSWFQSLSFHHICSIPAICLNQTAILTGILSAKNFLILEQRGKLYRHCYLGNSMWLSIARWYTDGKNRSLYSQAINWVTFI